MNDKLIKLLNLTRSENDGEALSAIRKVNMLMGKVDMTWETVINPATLRKNQYESQAAETLRKYAEAQERFARRQAEVDRERYLRELAFERAQQMQNQQWAAQQQDTTYSFAAEAACNYVPKGVTVDPPKPTFIEKLINKVKGEATSP